MRSSRESCVLAISHKRRRLINFRIFQVIGFRTQLGMPQKFLYFDILTATCSILPWACICGSMLRGHHCASVMAPPPPPAHISGWVRDQYGWWPA